MLSPRARRILFAVVTEYIETGTPVGSRTLSKRRGLDLSAASIRNVLSDLDEAGYLFQPHTSAGRIPTDRAIRLFVDTLMEMKIVPTEDRASLRARVADIYANSEDPLADSGKLLSQLSGNVGVVTRQSRGRSLQQLRFMPTRPGQMLAVLVFQDGSVENRFVPVDGPIQEAELTRIHNLLSDVIEGRSLGEVRELFARRLADDRLAIDALKRKAFDLAHRAIAGVPDRSTVRIEGQRKLLDMPEYGDIDRLKRLVVALEEREEIVGLLDKTLAAGAVTVFVGSETGELGDGQLSLIVAPYAENGQVAGALGVLGPTRMDYAKVMPLVDAAAAAVTDAVSNATRR
ncbi:MAG: heat-inducible transcription repressor HrcA [Polyangiaceae bacterium]|jgi:heat-inducible transcriptional repressor|nr:heat-inducible transcription repressor HrcA [Polyangiaceae bacterium]